MDIASSQLAASTDHGDGYDAFLAAIQQRVTEVEGPAFVTSASDLGRLFLDHISPEQRQTYTCSACSLFLRVPCRGWVKPLAFRRSLQEA